MIRCRRAATARCRAAEAPRRGAPPRSAEKRPARPAASFPEVISSISFELDLALDRPGEADAGDRDGRLGGQLLVALEATVGERLAHRLLDLALGGDAERLEELADAGVEGVFVHRMTPGRGWTENQT